MMRQAVEEVGREKMREKEMEKGMLMRERNMREAREQVEEKGGKEDVERWAREMGGRACYRHIERRMRRRMRRRRRTRMITLAITLIYRGKRGGEGGS